MIPCGSLRKVQYFPKLFPECLFNTANHTKHRKQKMDNKCKAKGEPTTDSMEKKEHLQRKGT